ncbi:MAG: DUF6691 family protein [Pikeienuella sp.]
MRVVVALIAGTLFGVGLVTADMTNPARVIAFLDLFGAWDPTLAFVMGGAMVPMFAAWAFSRRIRPLLAASFPPLRSEIDARLVGGSAMFGAGWGLSGFCPGPALAALSFGGTGVIVFTGAMIAGMFAQGFAMPTPARA